MTSKRVLFTVFLLALLGLGIVAFRFDAEPTVSITPAPVASVSSIKPNTTPPTGSLPMPAPAPVVTPAPAAATPPAEPAKDETALLPGFVGPKSWNNLGTATASAAFETHCWAIDRTEPDTLLTTIDLTEASRAKLKGIFDRLPPADQAKYGSPERMLAFVWVYFGLPFPGFMIQRETAHPTGEVGVILQLQYGQQGVDREFMFQPTPDGMRKVTPDSQVDEFLQRAGLLGR